MISPLQKKTRAGALYVRFPDIQARLLALDQLPPQELITSCQSPEQEPGAVPSECVLTFVRREWAVQNKALYEPLLAVLLERLRRRLPRAVSRDGKTESMARSDAAEQVQDTFISMLIGEVNMWRSMVVGSTTRKAMNERMCTIHQVRCHHSSPPMPFSA